MTLCGYILLLLAPTLLKRVSHNDGEVNKSIKYAPLHGRGKHNKLSAILTNHVFVTPQSKLSYFVIIPYSILQ